MIKQTGLPSRSSSPLCGVALLSMVTASYMKVGKGFVEEERLCPVMLLGYLVFGCHALLATQELSLHDSMIVCQFKCDSNLTQKAIMSAKWCI